MDSPFWHAAGIFGVVGFSSAVVLSLIARRWFESSDAKKARYGALILSYLGGAANARTIDTLMAQRKVKQQTAGRG